MKQFRKQFTDRFDAQILKWVGGGLIVLFLGLALAFHNTPPPIIKDGRHYSYHDLSSQKPIQSISEVFQPLEPVSLSNVSFTPGNDYEAGNCTWYVAETVKVPAGLGNANTWDDSAQSMGFTVSNTPTVGAVAQTDAGYYGHVAVVIAVEGDQVLIREMNSLGLGVVDERLIPLSSYVYITF